MIAYLFPGQGSQFVGMGKDLYNDFPESKSLFDNADEILKYKISDICFNGPEDLLKQTENTQPALFLHSMAIFEIMKRFKFDATAGHSLGEYSALCAAGAMKFDDALQLVRKRGQLMQESGIRNIGTMAAIVGISIEKVEELCKEASEVGIVQPANFNSPGQIVISGSVEGIRKGIELAKKYGAKLAKELVVSGAFHSPLMKYAYDNITEYINNIEITLPTVKVFSNVSSNPFTSIEEIKKLLIEQILAPVKWQQIIENMSNNGIEKFIEIGSGKVLSGLVKRINPKAETKSIGTSQELREYLNNG